MSRRSVACIVDGATGVAPWTSKFFNEADYFYSNYFVSSITCSSSSEIYSLLFILILLCKSYTKSVQKYNNYLKLQLV